MCSHMEATITVESIEFQYGMFMAGYGVQWNADTSGPRNLQYRVFKSFAVFLLPSNHVSAEWTKDSVNSKRSHT
jgi:hypothetical protein